MLELYDASPRDLSPVHLVLGSSIDTLSSYRPLQLEVPPTPLAPGGTPQSCALRMPNWCACLTELPKLRCTTCPLV